LPAINAVRDRIDGGTIGRSLHFNGHYGSDPRGPMSWRWKGRAARAYRPAWAAT